jgi:hypothetical protein
MSTGLIIAIIVVALILIALFAFVLPRARQTAQVKARERELHQRRERVVDEHRGVATERERQAEMAELKAREARSEAQLHQERAELHERGAADDELVADHERDKFAPALDKDPNERRGTTETTGTTGTTGTTHTDEPGRFDREQTDEQSGSRRAP